MIFFVFFFCSLKNKNSVEHTDPTRTSETSTEFMKHYIHLGMSFLLICSSTFTIITVLFFHHKWNLAVCLVSFCFSQEIDTESEADASAI